MKYIPNNYKLSICKRILFLVVFLFGLLHVQAQSGVFKNGIQQGVVKVKFEESMTTTLSTMQIKTKGKLLSTGITSFDKAASSIKAMKMERLIPECPNPVLEAKHRKAGLHLWYVVEFDQSIDPLAAANALKSVGGVKIVEREYFKNIAPSKVTPYTTSPSTYATLPFNDPFLKDQWHYINTGQLNLPGNARADANMAAAWKVTGGRSNIIVAVQDQGMDVNHEDLKANMWVNKGEIPGNGIDDDGNGYIDDINGFNFVKLSGKIDAEQHGTHVAGTVAAVNNNGLGVSGVAGGTGNGDGAKIMSLQIIGGAVTAGQIFKSFVYAADMGAVISQNSWGYSIAGASEKDVLDGIDYFIATAGDYAGSPMKGGIALFSSGNDSGDGLYWPGVYDKCFSVSAVGPEWKIAGYSNYGKWVEISAPGGDIDTYGVAKAGVLSTLPGNKYGYMQGTSMACPHVSGIAALAIASSDKQMTSAELRARLLTSVTNIDAYNPNYIGKLGTGSIDAGLAVKTNAGIAPDKITSLAVKGIAQEFATLQWTVPADADDVAPTLFSIYYATEAITNDNLNKATKVELKNDSLVGKVIPFEINGLLGTTKYYFAVISSDRWGNRSELSNIVTGTTNNGPTIDVNTGTVDKIISLSANIAQSGIASKNFLLLNHSDGILRWDYSVRNVGHTPSPTAYSLRPVSATPRGIAMQAAAAPVPVVRSAEIGAKSVFTATEKMYIDYTSVYIGDTDPEVTTSGANKFIVSEAGGFNLTQVKFDSKYTLGTGPLIIQVYKGGLTKDKLLREQSYQPEYSWMTSHSIALQEQVYFEKGSEFYIVVHVPPGNGYSLGIGNEKSPEYSDYSYYSADYGTKWVTLASAGVGQTYAWSITAVSQLPNIADFITLNPASGSVNGNSEASISLKADGTQLINGTYNANVVFKSNDSKNTEYRMPVQFDIAGHKPAMAYPKIVEFGSIFKNAESTIDVLVENKGYGLIKDLTATIDNPQFTLVAESSNVDALGESIWRVKFKPTSTGNVNGKLAITNGQYTYTISLFGVGAETAEIMVSPTTQATNNITIGDVVNSTFTISNTGGYPLKYFIPGFDKQEINKDWPTKYHSYGYIVRSNDARIGVDASLTYQFDDISATGIDITSQFIDSNFSTVPFGFDFPYYGVNQSEIYITRGGFTTFSLDGQPYNAPQLEIGLKGYISLMGYTASASTSTGKIQYKALSDRLIIQYTHIGYPSEGYFTAQMVLFANGNIRFYYKDVPQTGYFADLATILIEDLGQKDGILVRKSGSNFLLNNETVIGFDYAGPSIITAIENASGVVAPGESVPVTVSMDTQSLLEGTTVRNVSIVNNDPLHPSKAFSAILNVTVGGVGNAVVSTQKMDFGVTYQGYAYAKDFTIRNKGSKAVTIASMVLNNTKFAVSGSMTIAPGINEIYTVVPNTATIADLNDELLITFSDGTSATIDLETSVRSVPVPVADLSAIDATLNIGEKKSYSFEVENTGGSDLEVSVIGGQWFRFEEETSTPVTKFDYYVKAEKDGEPSYNWVDIIPTGTKVPYDITEIDDKTKFWADVELPFSFSYYGTQYTKIKAGMTGIIALGGDPDAKVFPSIDALPLIDGDAAFIFPLWSPGGFDEYNHPDDAGLYYQVYPDKVIISWAYYVNLFGWGQSFQAILYKDGTIKYQYKRTEGTSDGTGSGLVGIQDTAGKKFTSISNRSGLVQNKGLAFVIAPDNAHVVAPNTKIQGNLVLDALNVYGGTFADKFLIKTNAPASPQLFKPVSVIVEGVAKAEAPAVIDLGDTEVAFNEQTWSYKSLEKQLVITNTGKAPFTITGAAMRTGGKYLTQLLYVSGWFGGAWTPIEDLWGTYPQQLLLPGASFTSFVRFAPEVAGTYEDVLVLSSTIGDIEVKLTGFGYDSPIINVDNTPINVSFTLPAEEATKAIAFDNVDGGYKLDYTVSVNYEKALAETTSNEKIATAKADTSQVNFSLIPLSKTKATIIPYAGELNRKIEYVDPTKINNSIGSNWETSTEVSTKFVADKTGFNLSDVGTYIFVGNEDSPSKVTINAEVRVGGTNIANARSVAKASIDFDFTAFKNDTIVKQNITLDQAVQILPNEEFYVLFDFPMELGHPQSLQLGGVDVAPKRYWLFSEGDWYDLQDVFGNIGFAMYAGEREFKESGWIKLLSTDAGTLQKGESTKTDFKIIGSLAQRGDQKANIVIRSSDVKASVVSVPVSLHLNEAPAFIDAPTSLMIGEKDVRNLAIVVKDKEDNTFQVEIVKKPDFATVTVNTDNSVSVSLAPDYGTAGNYQLVMKATDQYDAVNEYTMDIHVAKTNRAPQYIKESDEFRYDIGSTPIKVDIKELFEDPDGDKMIFTVTTANSAIVEVYQSGTDYFVVEPKKAGTVKLTFVVTDSYGASTTHAINVIVEACLNPENFIVQKWNNALLFNNQGEAFVGYQWFKNGSIIPGATKQYYAEKTGELDFEAQYVVQLIAADGKTAVTCAIQPVKKGIVLKAYPNPVQAGQAVVVEAQLPDLDVNPVTIQVINLSGRIIKTISSKDVETSVNMPTETGYYLVKVTNKYVEQTFRIIVQ